MKTGDIVKHYSETHNNLGIIRDIDADCDGALVWFPRQDIETFIPKNELEKMADWQDFEKLVKNLLTQYKEHWEQKKTITTI